MCELCRLVFENNIQTELIYKDDICIITICNHPEHRKKRIPIVVLNRHSKNPSKKEMNHIKKVCKRLYPNKRFRGYMNKLPEHYHDHLL